MYKECNNNNNKQMFIEKKNNQLTIKLILICLIIYMFSYVINKQNNCTSLTGITGIKFIKPTLTVSNSSNTTTKEANIRLKEVTVVTKNITSEPPAKRVVNKIKSIVKSEFENIYKSHKWGQEGDGSGSGSTINYTRSVRAILRQVIDEYSIESMLDAPCGSFHWMPIFLKNLTEDFKRRRGKQFRYHGVDAVEGLITAAKAKYSNESDWDFSVCDFSSEDLPNGYDLIFSRDALQHLPFDKVLDSLKAYSRVQGAKYLLVGSYLGIHGQNKYIRVGEYFRINLIDNPFNLNKYIRIYDEYKTTYEPKSLILYDIPNYLSKIDFDLLKAKMGNQQLYINFFG